MSDLISEVPASSPDFQSEAAQKLASLFPEVIADGKIDVAALQTLLGDDIAGGGGRFGLFWPGKTQAIRAAQTPTTATLAPDRENSVHWDTTQNVVIEGDNLEVLKILQKHYYGQIKMIYIDPPYNTGNDFVYEDDYTDPLGAYLDITGQRDGDGKLSTNTESAGRFHSNWLNMMYPRLKLARNLLREDGALFVSIDDNEDAKLRLLCDELFGEQNFIASLTWPVGAGTQAGHFVRAAEAVLVYAKRKHKLKNFRGGNGVIEDRATKKISAKNPESIITFPAGTRFEAPDGTEFSGTWGQKEKITLVAGEMKARDKKLINDVQLSAGWAMADQMRSFFKGEETFDSKGQKVLEFYINAQGGVRYKKERSVVNPPTILKDLGTTSEATKYLDDLFGTHIFNFPKPVGLIRFFISLLLNDGSGVVLDFFAGSGTTAHAVMALNAKDGGNRRCISVQLPELTDEKSEARKAGYETISEITRERIRRAGSKILAGEASMLDGRAETLDVGFRAYKLVDTNFTKWHADASMDADKLSDLFTQMGESTDDAARPEALLTEVLLKLGFSLIEQVENMDVADLQVFSVVNGLMVAYLNEHVKPTLEQLRALVALEPERFVILEDAFQGDDELKTNLVQECRTHGVDLWTV